MHPVIDLGIRMIGYSSALEGNPEPQVKVFAPGNAFVETAYGEDLLAYGHYAGSADGGTLQQERLKADSARLFLRKKDAIVWLTILNKDAVAVHQHNARAFLKEANALCQVVRSPVVITVQKRYVFSSRATYSRISCGRGPTVGLL